MNKKEFNSKRYKEKFDAKTDWETELRIKLSLELIGKNKKVLDIGCYEGYVSERIKQLGNKVFGIEISKDAVNLCKKRGIKCFEQDIEKKFPFSVNTFDVVFAGEIIEHVFDTDGLLQEIKRVLKPNGFIVLSTPNLAALTRRLRLLFGINPLIEIGLISPDGKEKSAGHIRYFTIKSLEELLNRNGFFMEVWNTDFIALHRLRLIKLGKLFPSLGFELIVKAKINK
ncbi:MAG: class I SAM-dependent methyltransferase [Nanoarchaeota archaeon]|nr:class I SAM-dependent methyltransferase [Nanoarchaeota archaeon]